MNWWLGVASRDHVAAAVEGSFAQLGHGKRSAVAALEAGDGIIYYAPRTKMKGGEPVQSFVAIGKVRSGDTYSVEVNKDFEAYRVDVDYLPAEEANIHPLLDQLDLTKELGSKWGVSVRTSKRRLKKPDAERIAESMGADLSCFDE